MRNDQTVFLVFVLLVIIVSMGGMTFIGMKESRDECEIKGYWTITYCANPRYLSCDYTKGFIEERHDCQTNQLFNKTIVFKNLE